VFTPAFVNDDVRTGDASVTKPAAVLQTAARLFLTVIVNMTILIMLSVVAAATIQEAELDVEVVFVKGNATATTVPPRDEPPIFIGGVKLTSRASVTVPMVVPGQVFKGY